MNKLLKVSPLLVGSPSSVPPIMTYQQTCRSSVTKEPDDREQFYFSNEEDKTVLSPASFLIFEYQLLKEVSATYYWRSCNNSSNKLNTEQLFVITAASYFSNQSNCGNVFNRVWPSPIINDICSRSRVIICWWKFFSQDN